MVLLTSVFLIVFMAAYSFVQRDKAYAASYVIRDMDNNDISNSSYSVRRFQDIFTIFIDDSVVNASSIKWHSSNPDVLTFYEKEIGENLQDTTGASANIEVKNIGTTGLTVTVAEGNTTLFSTNITLNVAFSINEYVALGNGIKDKDNKNSGNKGVTMEKIFKATDTRRSLIMQNPESWIRFGISALEEPTFLNLNHGFASVERLKNFADATNKSVTWSSSNEDVIRIAYDKDLRENILEAVAAGSATLSVTYHEGNYEYSDEIQVYVRPQITHDGDSYNSEDNGNGIATITNGDKLGVSVEFDNNPLESISDKIDWIITKESTDGNTQAETVLVRDSQNNGEYKDEANLIWIPAETSYQLKAKAGVYTIQFYVHGTYAGFEEAKINIPGCKPVSISHQVNVPSDYRDKTIFLNIGGQYNLPDGVNITESDFSNCFETTIEPTSAGAINDCITFDSSKNTITANKVGSATITITAKEESDYIRIPAIAEKEGVITRGDKIKLIINISNSFMLNISDMNMSVGQTETLSPIFGSNTSEESDIYHWSSDNDSFIKIEEINPRTVNITALKATPTASPVTVTLQWTSLDGVTLTASCKITISPKINSFHIKPAKLTMNIGETQTITTDLTAKYTLSWISSDTSVATVVDSSGATPAAQVTAKKPGNIVLTAINVDNNTYSTCLLTVVQPVTELDIGIDGKATSAYEVDLAEGFVFMEALYKPNNATEKNFKWDSQDKTVATVDQTGKVTLLKEGSTLITCKAANVGNLCNLTVITKPEPTPTPPVVKPLTSIKPDATELNMIKGDTHTINLTLEPRDATDTNVTWTSLDEKVAKVDATGKVTAAGVGSTSIIIEAALANSDGNKAKATVKINVRDKLQSIAFESKATYINVGGTKQMEIIYKPDENVNKDVTFKSSDTSIFTVDNKGVIKGVAVGQAVLSCESKELGQAGVITCMVTVTASEIPAKDFSVTPAAETIYIGATLQLTKKFNPENATNQTVTWSSSDTSIATVNTTGTVKAVKEGKATISAVYTDTKDNKPLIRTSTITVEAAPIPVTDFDINPDTSNIIVGDKFTITPVFKPNDATNKNVEYQSLDEGVIKVSDKGEVTGVGAGDAIIQCQAEDGGFIATCFVHVDNAVEFSLSPSTKSIVVGRTFKLKKVINPANAKKAATWSTSNSSIATVDQDGNVTAKRLGKCTITCKLTKYNQRARCRVKVEKLKSSIGVTNKNIRIGVGQSYKLKNTITTNDTKKPKLSWKTANKRVASVNKNGKIKGKRVGKTKITVTTSDGVRAKATCKVRVIQRVSSIRLNSDYVEIYTGKSKKLKAKRKPSNATIKKIKWTSGDENIVRVRPSGKIRAVAVGNTYITAAATDGSKKKARCYVKVLESVPATSIVVAQSKLTLQRGDSTGLTYKVLPDGNTDKLKFASDNKRVVTVNKNGRVTAVGTGDATVTILASSGVSSEVNINVVALNKSSITMRQYDTETLEVLGASSNVTWYSSNANVATIDSSGKVSGKSIGTTTVYAYIDGCRLSCTVTITSL